MSVPRRPVPRYLIAHACFECRKSFKVSPRPDCSAVCPSCGGTIFEMGRAFKAPASQDLEQWAKVEALYAAGFRFCSYRSTDAPPLPERLAEVESFIRNNQAHPLRRGAPNYSLKRTNQSLRD